MRSRHCAAECRLDRWSSCIRSMSDLGQSAVLTVRRPLPAFPHKQTFSGSVGMFQWCQRTKSLRDSPLRGLLPFRISASRRSRSSPLSRTTYFFTEISLAAMIASVARVATESNHKIIIISN